VPGSPPVDKSDIPTAELEVSLGHCKATMPVTRRAKHKANSLLTPTKSSAAHTGCIKRSEFPGKVVASDAPADVGTPFDGDIGSLSKLAVGKDASDSGLESITDAKPPVRDSKSAGPTAGNTLHCEAPANAKPTAIASAKDSLDNIAVVTAPTVAFIAPTDTAAKLVYTILIASATLPRVADAIDSVVMVPVTRVATVIATDATKGVKSSATEDATADVTASSTACGNTLSTIKADAASGAFGATATTSFNTFTSVRDISQLISADASPTVVASPTDGPTVADDIETPDTGPSAHADVKPTSIAGAHSNVASMVSTVDCQTRGRLGFQTPPEAPLGSHKQAPTPAPTLAAPLVPAAVRGPHMQAPTSATAST